jgi:hypothetical protein
VVQNFQSVREKSDLCSRASREVLVPALTHLGAPWFRPGPDAGKQRDALLLAALATAVKELKEKFGNDMKSKPGVWFATGQQIVGYVRQNLK